MYLIPMIKQMVWHWSHVRTLKYAEVMLPNQKREITSYKNNFVLMPALVLLVAS